MPDVDRPDLTAAVREIVNRWPCVGLTVMVVRDGRPAFFAGHGLADIASHTPVTDDTVFRVASITKTFTAIAVLQLVEQGRVDLDASADEHLRAYRLVPAEADWRPATVRQLLTHTAGIGEQVPRSRTLRPDFGESVPAGRPVPTPAAFYRGRLRLDAEPGTRFRYTDHGPTTLGQIVEDVSGRPFDRYLRESVFAPLGMTDTDLVPPDRLRPRLATGYRLRSSGPRPVPDRGWVTAGASNALSTPRDMGRYLAALLGRGANEHGRVLEPATLATMYDPQYQPDPRIPGMGLAFFRSVVGGHRVVEHQGLLPGFDSQLLLAPDDGVGIMAVTNGTSQGPLWVPAETGCLLRQVLGVPDEAVPVDVPHHPEVWGDLCGWYHLPGPLTDVRLRTMIGAGAEVVVRGGRLVLRFLTPLVTLARGLPLHPDDASDPYAFRLDLSEFGMTSMRVVFSQQAGAGTTAVHLDLMPVTAYKQPATTNPRRWLTGALAAGTAAVAVRSLGRHRGPTARAGRTWSG